MKTVNLEKIMLSGLHSEQARQVGLLGKLLMNTYQELEETGTADFEALLREIFDFKSVIEELELEINKRENNQEVKNEK